VLMRQEMAEIATEVKSRKRKYIRTAETLIVGEIADLIAKKDGSGLKEGRKSLKRVRAQRRCGRCRETSYNARTCMVEIVNLTNSEDSK
jgi:hypothetical protein